MANRHLKYTAEMVAAMVTTADIDEESALLGPDSESEVSEEGDPDYVPGGEMTANVSLTSFDSDSEVSSDPEPEDQFQTQRERESKNGSYWCEHPPPHRKTKTHNILRCCPGPAPGSMAISPKNAWMKFICENIMVEIINCTNHEGRQVATERGKEWKAIDEVELNAFIGLSLLAGGEKSWDVDVRELFLDPLQNPMYKATMGLTRFEDIRSFLRFDDKRTRAVRLETDHLAAFRYVWECFLLNCRRQFIPSDCVTIDEQLVPFRGRCRFLQYMPSKPAKYGIKIFWMCDARVPYAINGTVYTGK